MSGYATHDDHNFTQIFTEQMPFAHLRDGDVLMEVVIRGRRPPRPGPGTASLNDRMWDLMQDCWETLPSARPSVEEIIRRISLSHSEMHERRERESMRCFLDKVDILSVPRPVVILAPVTFRRGRKVTLDH